METINELKNFIEQVKNQNCNSYLYFIQRNKAKDHVNFEVFKTIIEQDVSSLLIDILIDYLIPNLKDDIELIKFNPGIFDDRNVIEYIDIEQVKNCKEIIDKLEDDLSLELPEKIDVSFLRNLWAYAVKINCGTESIIYFNKYAQGKVLTQSKLLSLFYKDGRFNRIGSDIFTLQKSIDCVVISNRIYIIRRNNFEQIFCLYEHYHDIAIQTLGELGSLLVDVDDLTDAFASDLKKLRKIACIAYNNFYSTLTFDKVKKVIEDYNLNIQLDEHNQRIKADKSQIWDLLKLLNDDFLSSEMTGNKYEAHSKRFR